MSSWSLNLFILDVAFQSNLSQVSLPGYHTRVQKVATKLRPSQFPRTLRIQLQAHPSRRTNSRVDPRSLSFPPSRSQGKGRTGRVETPSVAHTLLFQASRRVELLVLLMGNCLPRSFSQGGQQMVKVVTHSGGVMELYTPITAECITNGFPRHGLFRSNDHFSRPLPHREELLGGEVYHLRPLNDPHLRLPSVSAPYRMSFDHHGLWKRHDIDLFPRCVSGGGSGVGDNVWRVKLVISPAQLTEILSQEAKTEALVESVRTVAKCRTASVSSTVNSDQWSRSSSRKCSSENVGVS